MFEPDDLLLALTDAKVEFVVIGGVAVGVHGYVRATKDLDIVPDPAPENLTRLAGLLAYPELVKSALTVRFRGTDIRICGIEHLRAMKCAAGRAQDLADLRELDSAASTREALEMEGSGWEGELFR